MIARIIFREPDNENRKRSDEETANDTSSRASEIELKSIDVTLSRNKSGKTSIKEGDLKRALKVKTSNDLEKLKLRQTYSVAKIFFLITVLYLISAIACFAGVIFNSLYIMYVYFITHIGSPVTYFVVDRSFRRKAIRLFK